MTIKKSNWNGLKKVIKDGPLAALGPKDVAAFRKYGAQQELKNASINHHIDELRAFTRWATNPPDETIPKLLSHDPLADCKKLPVPEPVNKVISDQDFVRLMASVPAYLKEMIWVDWQTGLRLANVVSLRYDQIDFEAGGIEFTADEMKKGKPVFIDLEPELLEWFQKKHAAHPDDVYVWPSPHVRLGQTSSRNSSCVSTAFANHARKLGINATFHSIRHTFATRWLKNGVSLFMVGKFLSHKSLQSTKRYEHVEDLESQKQAKNRVAKMHVPKLPTHLKAVG